MWFIFNLQRRKICTASYNILQWTIFSCVVFKGKNPFHLVVAISARCENLTLLWFHVENRLPHFAQDTSLTPSPKPAPFSAPHTHTCDTVLLRENDVACQMSSLSDTMHILVLCMFSSTVEL
jgi:hypothetical protein